MEEGLRPIIDDKESKHFILHDHLIEDAKKSPYLSAIERETGKVVFVDGQYFARLSGNIYVEGHEPVRTSVPKGNMAEEWTLCRLTPEEAAAQVRFGFEFDSQRGGGTPQTISNSDVESLLGYVRGDVAERPRVTPVPKV